MSIDRIRECLRQRILVLDGAMGTMVQRLSLEEADFRGDRFAGSLTPLKGCNDVLVLTRPEAVAAVHRAYLEAGADIVSTNTFNANAISLADYGLAEAAYEINREGARLAREAADRFSAPGRPRFVAGSIGPTNRTASLSPDVNDPGARAVTFDELKAAYTVQAEGLIDGGADLLLIETVFDTLNAKAAVAAVQGVCDRRGVRVPVMLSGTVTDAAGRTLSGQTVDAFYVSLSHTRDLLSIGLNCAFGAEQLRPYLELLSAVAACPVSAHPNAGLPDGFGRYDQTPERMRDTMEDFMRAGLLNIAGGCCGTTPEHIRLLAEAAAKYPPRPIPAPAPVTCLSGLEVLRIVPEINFVNIGERANVAGSAKFARLIREDRYEEALSVAREQVDNGAQVVDVCMDDAMIDGAKAMTRFLNLAASEPDIARVPFMIDSSKWEVIEAGLKCVQGKAVVNSISLKEGEALFLERARTVRGYGAAAVVMLFDERGQADVYERKIEVAGRAYRLLVEDGFPPEDIIFDPNVLSVATGMEQHDRYGVDFIEACRWIKRNCPRAKVSGGISNLSFAFRGNNPVREAMHSVFLYHAIRAGLDMAIVNAGMLRVYEDIEPELLKLVEDVVLNRGGNATERLVRYAQGLKGEDASDTARPAERSAWREGSVDERLAHALLRGVTDHVEEDTLEAYRAMGSPLAVIEGPLMAGMDRVGELFGAGKMFLPQVVKSARVMKKAVGVLTPYIEQAKQAGTMRSAGRVVIATVKGDVHDIGKNIVSVVLSCNGFQVVDLGVMTPAGEIVDKARKTGADIVMLSGLITPSLDEMAHVVREMERAGLKVPVMVGGATTSPLHTAVKLAPLYSAVVAQTRDASACVRVAADLLSPERHGETVRTVRAEQERLRKKYAEEESRRTLLSPEEARRNRAVLSFDGISAPLKPGCHVLRDIDLNEVARLINWTPFFGAWELKGRYPDILSHPEKGEEARKLFDDARTMLRRVIEGRLLEARAVVGLYPARSEDEEIVVDGRWRFFVDRNRRKKEDGSPNRSLADFIAPAGSGVTDYIGAFAATAGIGADELAAKYRAAGDDYSAILVKLLADRLAEALAEWLHYKVRTEYWGYAPDEDMDPDRLLKGDYRGIRPAFGYPACPDHANKKTLFELMEVGERIGLRLTENHMMVPGASVSGLIFAHPEAKYLTVL